MRCISDAIMDHNEIRAGERYYVRLRGWLVKVVAVQESRALEAWLCKELHRGDDVVVYFHEFVCPMDTDDLGLISN